jgi:hypothetical protein
VRGNLPVCSSCSLPYHSSLDKCPNCFDETKREPQKKKNPIKSYIYGTSTIQRKVIFSDIKKDENDNGSVNIQETDSFSLKPLKLNTPKKIIAQGVLIVVVSVIFQNILFWSINEEFIEVLDLDPYFSLMLWLMSISLYFICYIFIIYGFLNILAGVLMNYNHYFLSDLLKIVDSAYEFNGKGITELNYYTNNQKAFTYWYRIEELKILEIFPFIELKRLGKNDYYLTYKEHDIYNQTKDKHILLTKYIDESKIDDFKDSIKKFSKKKIQQLRINDQKEFKKYIKK